MKILVTGASGFIGGSIVESLSKERGFEIIATGRSPMDKFKPYNNITYFKQDLTEKINRLSCDVCIHCAGLADDRSTEEELVKSNIRATENLLLAIKDCSLLIYISSASVYDFSDGESKKEEDVVINKNLSSYGKSKLDAENVIMNSGIKSIYILRPRAVYGPGDRVLLPRILKLIKGNRMIIPINLSKKSSLTHIENLCEAVELSLFQGKFGAHIFNVADNQSYDLNAVFSEILVKKVSRKSFIRVPTSVMNLIIFLNRIPGIKGQLSKQSYKYIVDHSILSIDKAKEQLNYTGRREFFKSINQLDI